MVRAIVYWGVFLGMGLLWLLAYAVRAVTAAVIQLTCALAAPVAWLGEYEADRTAAKLGFGPALYDALTTEAPAASRAQTGPTRTAQMWASPPPVASRLRRIRSMMGGPE